MGIEEIVKVENNRGIENIDKIYLFLDAGGPWYKAYEWSAYLMEFYPGNTGEKLKAIKRGYKAINDPIVNVSIQLKSIDKYLPGKIIVEQNENMLILSANIKQYNDKIAVENFNEKLNSWKGTIELNDKRGKQTEKEQKNIFGSPVTFMKIMQNILTYDTYGKNEADLRDFVLTLKENCSNLIF